MKFDRVCLEFLGILRDRFGLDFRAVDIFISEGNLEVVCDNASEVDYALESWCAIAATAKVMAIDNVRLMLKGEPVPKHEFPSDLSTVKFPFTIMPSPIISLPKQANGMICIPDRITLNRMILANPDLSVIRWDGSIGIASGANCSKASGLKPDEWKGRSMNEKTPDGNSTWIPEEFARFQSALFNHLAITEYSYRAHLYTGELVEMCVNATLGTYKTWLIRSVEALECARV